MVNRKISLVLQFTSRKVIIAMRYSTTYVMEGYRKDGCYELRESSAFVDAI